MKSNFDISLVGYTRFDSHPVMHRNTWKATARYISTKRSQDLPGYDYRVDMYHLDHTSYG